MHGASLKRDSSSITSTLNGLISALTAHMRGLGKLCDQNSFSLDVVTTLGAQAQPLLEQNEIMVTWNIKMEKHRTFWFVCYRDFLFRELNLLLTLLLIAFWGFKRFLTLISSSFIIIIINIAAQCSLLQVTNSKNLESFQQLTVASSIISAVYRTVWYNIVQLFDEWWWYAFDAFCCCSAMLAMWSIALLFWSWNENFIWNWHLNYLILNSNRSFSVLFYNLGPCDWVICFC